MAERRIGIVGFGFSGLLVTAHLVRQAPSGTVIYIVADDLNAMGVAYSTTNPQHLLNVPAGKMGAFPEAISGFFDWLQTADAAIAKQRLGIHRSYEATDFAPRALYAAYLQSIWQETQQIATQRQVTLKLVESLVTSITPGAPLTLLTARGDAIALDKLLLATGNETKPIMAHLPPSCVIQNPWAPNIWATAKQWTSPVVLMGVGLTAVDTILALRQAGYEGDIVAFSRNGSLPQPHQPAHRLFAFKKEALTAASSLSALLRLVRQAIKTHGEWRPVIDALRPHTPWLWQRLSAPDQKRFLARLLTRWNVHRHRMAPEIHAAIEAERATGRLRIIASKHIHAQLENGTLELTLMPEEGDVTLQPSRIINCTGPQMNLARSLQPLWKNALAQGVIEPHITGVGIAVDPQQRAWGTAHPHLYAMGTLLTGQLLETTAVPELRDQAAQIAQALLA